MTRETINLISRLSRLLKISRARVVNEAVYRMAVTNRLAGVAHDWEKVAKERGLSVKRVKPDELGCYIGGPVHNG